MSDTKESPWLGAGDVPRAGGWRSAGTIRTSHCGQRQKGHSMRIGTSALHAGQGKARAVKFKSTRCGIRAFDSAHADFVPEKSRGGAGLDEADRFQRTNDPESLSKQANR